MGEYVVFVEARGIRGAFKVAARFEEKPDANRVEAFRAQVTGLFRRTYADWPSAKLTATVVDQSDRPTTFN